MSTPLSRAQFPVAERFHYLNHAGIAPLPRDAAEAMAADVDDLHRNGSTTFDARAERDEKVRAAAAQLLGVATPDVAFVKNTTEGLGFVANGLDWQPGDRVLVPDREFQSNLFPWLSLRARGVDVELLEPEGAAGRLAIDAFAATLARHPTRLVSVSWVQFSRGWRTDIAALAELCHRHGALLCVDVIQGLGVIPCQLAEWGVDFAAADAHKWLLGPQGIGVFYASEQARDQLRVLEPGWNSILHREEWDNFDLALDPTARRFEGGSMNQIGIAGLGASIDLSLTAGVDQIWRHVDGLCDRLCDRLAAARAIVVSDRSSAGRSAIVSFVVPDVAPDTVVDRLTDAGVVCSVRSGAVRLAPHGYNDDDDIDTVIDVVRDL